MAGALLCVAVIGLLLIATLAVLRLWTRLERAEQRAVSLVYENAQLRRKIDLLAGAEDGPSTTAPVCKDGVLFVTLGEVSKAPSTQEDSFKTKSSSTLPPHEAALLCPTNAPLLPGMQPDAFDRWLGRRKRCARQCCALRIASHASSASQP